MKIWFSLIIIGIIIFFIGDFYMAANGGFVKGYEGIMIMLIGAVMFMVGILSVLQNGYRRIMHG